VGGARQKKTKQNYGGGQQVGHNQTFGSDVNRAGVPRRTPGDRLLHGPVNDNGNADVIACVIAILPHRPRG
jgi:hypothetical protein